MITLYHAWGWDRLGCEGWEILFFREKLTTIISVTFSLRDNRESPFHDQLFMEDDVRYFCQYTKVRLVVRNAGYHKGFHTNLPPSTAINKKKKKLV